MIEKNSNFENIVNEEYVYCQYCDSRVKRKNLKKHLNKKCKKYIISSTQEIDTDLKRVKDFDKLEELYINILLNEDKLSIIEYQKQKNNIKRLEIYFSENEKLKIKKEVEKKTRKSFKSFQHKTLSVNKFKCRYCNHFLSSYEELNRHESKHNVNDRNKFLTKEKNNTKINNLMTCEYCKASVNKKNYEKHLKNCLKNDLNSWMLCDYCQTKLKRENYKRHLKKCSKNKTLEEKIIKRKEKPISKEKFWEQSSSIEDIEKERITLINIEKHQAKRYQFKEDEELDPDLIDEDEYQKTFGIELDEKSQRVRDRVAFEHTKLYYKEEEEDKSEIKIFLFKMYKGYCQVCGYTFRKTNGENSFERFNWNDKRVVKVKKNLVSTADSLSLCRNCSANIKWGASYPNFVDTIREIEDFKNKSYDEIREKLHKVVDEDIPKIFEPLLGFDDIYALEIELDGKPRNIYFTNEHLLQFVTYLQKEDEVEEEVKIKKRKKEIYTKNSWLARNENIPKELAIDFLRATIYHPNHSSGKPVSMSSRAYEIYKNSYHGWAIDLNANPFLVGKAIERCKIEINNYIENKISDFHELKNRLHYCIRGAVATSNNDEYNGYYPLEKGRFMKFGWNAIDVDKGVEFLIRRLGI